MKLAVFNTKPDDRAFLQEANRPHHHELIFRGAVARAHRLDEQRRIHTVARHLFLKGNSFRQRNPSG